MQNAAPSKNHEQSVRYLTPASLRLLCSRPRTGIKQLHHLVTCLQCADDLGQPYMNNGVPLRPNACVLQHSILPAPSRVELQRSDGSPLVANDSEVRLQLR
eukprot:jgi/Ulvmu1/5099/UM021_0116.1